MRSSRPLAASSLALALLAGCAGSATSSGSPAPVPGDVVVVVAPASVDVAPGGVVSFAATVTGSADGAVTWEVEEGAAGGTVTSAGVYTAPTAAGTYHVAALSRSTPGKRGKSKVTVTAPPAVGVSVTPPSATVATGGTVAFAATVTGAANPAVTWSVAEASGCGAVGATGSYAAPSGAATCHVVARSVEDPAAAASATVTVTAGSPPPPPPSPVPVAVSVTPASGAADACRTLTFRATVTGTSDGAVTWSVQEGAAGGAITAAGVYTAPATAGTYHVVATSHADPARSTAVPVTVSERVVSVAVSPAAASATPGGSTRLSATVTTTCGSFPSLATLRADGTIAGN